MNKLAASVLVMFSLFASCTSDNFTSPSPTEDQHVTIGFGDIVFLKPNLRAGFKSLLSDSRCPRNAECLWKRPGISVPNAG